jgi:hypothetical protein
MVVQKKMIVVLNISIVVFVGKTTMVHKISLWLFQMGHGCFKWVIAVSKWVMVVSEVVIKNHTIF